MSDQTYNYESFERSVMEEDMSFQGGPRPGDPAPEIDLPTIDGGRFRLSDHRGKPVLFEFGSYT